jgi:hypothetical protein
MLLLLRMVNVLSIAKERQNDLFVCCRLHHSCDDALEILTFKATDAEGMIGRSSADLNDAYRTTAALRDAREHDKKIISRHLPRAAACHQNPSRFKQINR